VERKVIGNIFISGLMNAKRKEGLDIQEARVEAEAEAKVEAEAATDIIMGKVTSITEVEAGIVTSAKPKRCLAQDQRVIPRAVQEADHHLPRSQKEEKRGKIKINGIILIKFLN